ncbi:hypothetical protein G708_02685 [Escherichia coli HVH 32 (4-3773988)]|nr:hypothetical protein G708_02685 [Escherichia coli HVH 32 (4-3773988)]
MPFARYFCIFINVGLGEGAELHVGVAVNQTSDTSPWAGPGCNGTSLIPEDDGVLTKTDPANICGDVRMELMSDYAYGLSVATRC